MKLSKSQLKVDLLKACKNEKIPVSKHWSIHRIQAAIDEARRFEQNWRKIANG